MANPTRRTPENRESRDREEKELPPVGRHFEPEREKRETDNYSAERPQRPSYPLEDDFPDPERPRRPTYSPSEEEYPARPKRPPHPPEDEYTEPPRRPSPRPSEEEYPETPKPSRPPSYGETEYPEGEGQKSEKDPDEVISDIEKELAQKTAESDRLKQENDLYKNHKDALKAKADEIDVIVQAYGQALTQMQEQLADRKLYSTNKTPMLENKVRDIKVKIHRIIREVDDAIYYLEQEVDGLKRAQDDTEREKTAATNELTQKNALFDSLKKRKDDITSNLTTLNNLRTEIENDETGNKYPVMYFKIKGDYNRTLETTTPLLVGTTKYEALLNHAWYEIKDAMERLRMATINLEIAQAAYTEKNTELTKRKGSRRQDIITRLERL